MKSRKTAILSVVFFAVLVLSSLAGALSIGQIPARNGPVTPSEATLVAQKHLHGASEHIPNFEDWKNSKLSRPVVYYFPNGTKSAYEFTVLVNGKPDGFILVAAQRYMPPILEFGKGEAPSTRIHYAQKVAMNKGYKVGNLIYYGALTYGLQIGSNKMLSLVDRKVQNVPKNIKFHFRKSTSIAENEILKPTTSRSSVFPLEDGGSDEHLVSVVRSIQGVPAWTSTDKGGASTQYPFNVGSARDPWIDWDGCAAVAASMIIAYYEPQLKDEWDREAVIDVLHHTMGIDDNTGGSVWTTQVVGIENFKEEWDYLRGWIVYKPVYHDFTATFYEYWTDMDVISEVNNNHPFMLGLENGGRASDGTGPYGNHAVTGVGYIAACSEDYSNCELVYIEIHDTWNFETHYIYNGNWIDADIIKVRAS
ncbi:hypothetical protein [Thermococcus sp.]|uniref:hypothetical protein n=1 Tax=Thermococcus sp. TaxID=35749 RepID=UPI002631BD90|nr:hypothetical protein [Thermococcus sp.]